jgi:hypothetical protein
MEMVHIALFCTMYNPDHRPRISEIFRMLEGKDEVAGKWEAMKNIEESSADSPAHLVCALDYDADRSSSIELEAIELSEAKVIEQIYVFTCNDQFQIP